MLRIIGAVVVAVVLLVAVGDRVGLEDQRAWVVNGLQDIVNNIVP